MGFDSFRHITAPLTGHWSLYAFHSQGVTEHPLRPSTFWVFRAPSGDDSRPECFPVL